MSARTVAERVEAQANTAPFGLRLLCRATGLTDDPTALDAAYRAAVQLAQNVDHDCNPTYCAISDLRTVLDPDDARHEDAITLTRDQEVAAVMSYGQAGYLLGLATCWLLLHEKGGTR